MKSKHIDWILCIKCNHWVWPWSWPWPWIFKVKPWNSRISGIEGSIDIEQKGLIHDHDRDILVTKMRCKDLPDSDRGDFRCRRVVDWSSDYVKASFLFITFYVCSANNRLGNSSHAMHYKLSSRDQWNFQPFHKCPPNRRRVLFWINDSSMHWRINII